MKTQKSISITLRKDFGDLVFQTREKAGLTTKQLAKKLSCSQSYVYTLEDGRILPGLILYYNLAKIFNLTMDYFYKEPIKKLNKKLIIKPKTTDKKKS